MRGCGRLRNSGRRSISTAITSSPSERLEEATRVSNPVLNKVRTRTARRIDRDPLGSRLRAAPPSTSPETRRSLFTQLASAYSVKVQFDDTVHPRQVVFNVDDVDFFTALQPGLQGQQDDVGGPGHAPGTDRCRYSRQSQAIRSHAAADVYPAGAFHSAGELPTWSTRCGTCSSCDLSARARRQIPSKCVDRPRRSRLAPR